MAIAQLRKQIEILLVTNLRQKMSTRRIRFERVAARSVIIGVILFLGVLSMAYGYLQDNQLVLYIGLAVTILGALNGIIFSAIMPNALRFTRHGH